jgi:hypothetical protein
MVSGQWLIVSLQFAVGSGSIFTSHASRITTHKSTGERLVGKHELTGMQAEGNDGKKCV